MRLIDADALMTDFGDLIQANSKLVDEWLRWQIEDAINNAPTSEAVPIGVFEQVKWERDMAINQLKDIGKEFGEVMDDVGRVRHGHWIHEFPYVGHLTNFYLCSVCRAEWNAIDNDMERFDYCPRCGAKMDEVSE